MTRDGGSPGPGVPRMLPSTEHAVEPDEKPRDEVPASCVYESPAGPGIRIIASRVQRYGPEIRLTAHDLTLQQSAAVGEGAGRAGGVQGARGGLPAGAT